MSEKKLVTLKEIADELGVNYRTVIACKNYFSDRLEGLFDGRHTKYWSEYIEFFKKIFALKMQGYSYAMVQDILAQNPDLPGHERVLDVLSAYIEDEGGGGRMTEEDGGRRTMMEDDKGRGTTIPEEGGRRRTMNEDEGGGRTMEEDGGRGTTISEDRGGPMKNKDVDTNPSEGDENDQDVLFAQLKQELQAEFSALVDQKVNELLPQKLARLVNTVDARLLNATGEINGALTRFYQQIALLQEGIKAVEERIKTLEGDLGVESDQEFHFPEIDLEEIQVNLPKTLSLDWEPETEISQSEEQEEMLVHADMDFLKNSISNGRPDREAVIQWISAERYRNPEASYADLAEQLNQAKVPTLRGRYGWNRGVIRNLAVKNEL